MIGIPQAVRRAIVLLPVILAGVLLVLTGVGVPIGVLRATSVEAAGSSLAQPAQPGPDETLLRDPATGDFYLVYNHVLHAIADADTVSALGLKASSAMTATATMLAGLPAGPALSTRYVHGQPWPFARIASGAAMLTADLPAAPAGAIVRLTGTNFGPSALVHIRYAHGAGSLDVQTDSIGGFSVSIALPANEPLETMRIYAYGETSAFFAVEPFTIIPAPADVMVAGTPMFLAPGSLIHVSGGGFTPGEQVDIFLDSGSALDIAQADVSGNFGGATLIVPATTAPGSNWIVAYGTTSERTASSSITIQALAPTMPVVSFDATTATPGGLVWVTGAGYGAREKVQVAFDRKAQATATTGADGTFHLGITVPPSAQSGTHTVTATGSSTKRAVADLTIVALMSQLAVTPTVVMPGSHVVISGSGYLPAEQIAFAYSGAALQTMPGHVTAGVHGSFTATAVIPLGSVDGAADITAMGESSRAVALSTITVTHGVATTWYFTGDDTRGGDSTQLALMNTHNTAIHAIITYMFSTGSPMTETVLAPAHSRVTLDVNGVVGAGRNVSMKITADLSISAASTLFRPGRDFATIVGARAPETTWYLAEGYTGLSFQETIHVLNPGSVVARASVRVLSSSDHAGTTVNLNVPPLSSTSVMVNAIAPNQSVSAIVTADQSIVVARSEVFGVGGDGLTESLGVTIPSPIWLFPAGSTASNSEAYLTIFNPNPAITGTVTASYFDAGGMPLSTQTIPVAPLHRAQIAASATVHAGSFAVVLTADTPIVAEEPIYSGSPNSAQAGGSDVVGRNGASTHWTFAEGTTGAGYSESVVLQNPTTALALIEVTFYSANGKVTSARYTAPADGSVTIDVNKDIQGLVAGQHGVAVTALNGVPFVAEESIATTKFNYGTATAGNAR